MKYCAGNFYHIFNRGNNKQRIFFRPENYSFFLGKIRNEIFPVVDVVSYCLMPNHYHLLVFVGDQHTAILSGAMQVLERKIGTLQSSYTRAINNQERRVGSLFQAKAKSVEISDYDRAMVCFHYIHQNPVKAGLCKSFSDWEFSSYHEYLTGGDEICKRDLAYKYLGISQSPMEFEQQSVEIVSDEKVRLILKFGE